VLVEGDGTLRYDTKEYAEFHRIDPNKLRLHQHAGVEFIYVITRRLGLRRGTSGKRGLESWRQPGRDLEPFTPDSSAITSPRVWNDSG